MDEEIAELLRRANALSAPERAELAISLIESFDEAEDGSVQAAWNAEIALRLEDLSSGKVKPVSLEEARRRLSYVLD
jgi:putative addiction module component (TIGR02574 family)